MSLTSHAYKRLVKLNRLVVQHMRELNWLSERGIRRSSQPELAAMEAFEPRLMMSGNIAPAVITTNGVLNYTEHDPATVIDLGLTVSDADNTTLVGATVSITQNFVSSEDSLAFTEQNGITGSWNSTTDVLTLTGEASVADYQAALRSVTYVNSSDNPSTADREISFVANDGQDDSVAATRTITVMLHAPAAPGDFAATPYSSGQVDLSWTEGSENVTGFEVDRATNAAFTRDMTTVSVAATETDYSDTTVSAGTKYYYRIRAVNAAGQSENSTPANATTAAVTADAATFVSQSVPATLQAGQTYSVTVVVRNTGLNTWTTGGDWKLGSQNPQDALNWGMSRVELTSAIATGEEATFTFDVTAPPTTGSHDFQWRMVHEYVAWFGDYTPSVTVDVTAATTAPEAPSDLSATAVSGAVNLTWTDNSDNEAQFEIDRATNAAFYHGLTTLTSIAGTTSYSDTAVAAGTKYYYRIRSVNAAGQSEDSTPANATTAAVAADAATFVTQSVPNTLVAGETCTVTMIVRNTGSNTWTIGGDWMLGSQDPQDNLNWNMNRIHPPIDVATGEEATFTFDITAPATPGDHEIQLRMVHEFVAWFGDYTPVVTVNVTAATEAPAAPSDLSAAGISSGQVNLAWTDNSDNEAQFKIDRATDAAFSRDLVTLTAVAGTTSFSDTTPAAGTKYYYRIRSVNAAGQSDNSASATATTAAVTADTATFVSMSVPSAMAAGRTYAITVVVRNTGFNTWTPTGDWKLGSQDPQDNLIWSINRIQPAADIATGEEAAFTFDVTAPATPGDHELEWRMVHEYVAWFGDYTPVATVSVAEAPTAPGDLSAVPNGNGQIDLSWTDNSDAETGFVIERALDVDFMQDPASISLDADTTSYQWTGLTSQTTYYFRVRATADVFDSTNSAAVAATVQADAPVLIYSSVYPDVIREGDYAQISLQLTDTNTQDIHTALIDTGDQTFSQEAYVYDDGYGNIFVNAWVYMPNSGQQNVTVRVANQQNYLDVPLSLTVEDVAPTITLSGNYSADDGEAYTLHMSAYDPSPLDEVSSWTINWGDGTTETLDGNLTETTHVFDGGTAAYRITASVMQGNESYEQGSFVDASYGSGGVADVSAYLWYINATALQSGNKLVVAGQGPASGFELIRLLDNGSVDPTFGANGVAIANFGFSEVLTVAVPSTNMIVAVGNVGGDPNAVGVARFGADGGLIDSHATYLGRNICVTKLISNGSSLTVIGHDWSQSFVAQIYSDGTLGAPTWSPANEIIAGAVIDQNGNVITVTNAGVVHYGNMSIDSGVGQVQGWAGSGPLAVDDEGNIFVAGYQYADDSNCLQTIVKISPNGQVTQFARETLPVWNCSFALAVQPDGKLVSAGYSSGTLTPTMFVNRYTPEGTLDLHMQAEWGEASNLTVVPDGILISGLFRGIPGVMKILMQVAVKSNEVVVNSTGNAVDISGDLLPFTKNNIAPGVPEVTLRSAIQWANETPGKQTIKFNIPDDAIGGIWTIDEDDLPTITDEGGAVDIDATTQPTYGNVTPEHGSPSPVIMLSGSGLHFQADNSSVEGLAVTDFGVYGLWFDGADVAMTSGCYIGIEPGLIPWESGGQVGLDIDNSGVGVHFSLVIGNCTVAGVKIEGEDAVYNLVADSLIGVWNDEETTAANFDGIVICSGANYNTVDSNVISANTRYGVWITDEGTSNNDIYGNLIGTNNDSSIDIGNESDGVRIDNHAADNVIGISAGDGTSNIISGNLGNGVCISGLGTIENQVSGNYIGCDFMGSKRVGNMADGVVIEDSASNNYVGTDGDSSGDADEGNVIAGNWENGIRISGSEWTTTRENFVSGNLIGITESANPDIYNDLDGVRIDQGAILNIIGAVDETNIDAYRNIISGNGLNGVRLTDYGTTSNSIAGNYIGTTFDGAEAMPNVENGVLIENMAKINYVGTNANGSADSEEANVISGNTLNGVVITGEGTTENIVAGNLIGLKANGTEALPNEEDGVLIKDEAMSNIIGTNGDGTGDSIEGNTISGNSLCGVRVTGSFSMANRVAGNYIGTSEDGTLAVPNQADGVLLEAGASLNIVGTNGNGTGDTDEWNLISGNKLNGIRITGENTSDNRVAGNWIGLDGDGIGSIANEKDGVLIEAKASGNIIGTNGDTNGDVDEGNVISGNKLNGVRITGEGTTRNRVAGNYIGTSWDGTEAVPNLADGTLIEAEASENIIGTNGDMNGDSSEGNCISGNALNGVRITGAGTSQNRVAGNYVGLGPDGESDVHNEQNGVLIENEATENVIGSNTDGNQDDIEGNSIAYNLLDGIAITGGTKNAVHRNSVYYNKDLGIDIGETGMLLNDNLDADTGPNNKQNSPQVYRVVHNADGTTQIDGYIHTTPNKTNYYIEMYGNNADGDANWYLRGGEYLGFATTDTDAKGQGWFALVVDGTKWNITCTATDSDGNTSEFGSFGLNLRVDTNRDTFLNILDEDGEDVWSSTSGAIILPNADDDNGDDLPDNWRGENIDGDSAGTIEAADSTVNGANDVADIGGFQLGGWGTLSLPAGMKVSLEIKNPVGAASYFNGIAPNRLVRIFNPTKTSADGLVIEDGDSAILGPEISATEIEFVDGGGAGKLNIAMLTSAGEVTYGIEGVEIGSYVELVATLTLGTDVVATDTVQLRVAPFVAFSHKQVIDSCNESTSVPGGPTVYVEDLGADNVALRNALKTLLPGLVAEVPAMDAWWQDSFEIGYVQAPYGQMHMILGLPRGSRDDSSPTHQSLPGKVNEYERKTMMRDGVGLIPDFYTGVFGDQDDGGNFEVRPVFPGGAGRPLGTIIFSKGPHDSINTDIVDFLKGQDVQDVVDNLDLTWMYLGHTDEIVSFSSTEGNRARVVSPEAAWALLQITKLDHAGGTANMLTGMNNNPAGVTVDNILADAAMKQLNFSVGGYSDKIHDVTQAVGLHSPVSVLTYAGAPNNCLRRTGYLDVFDKIGTYGDEVQWRLTFTNATTYTIEHKGPSDTNWIADGNGDRTQDSFSDSRTVYILSDWWDAAKATANGQVITFTTKPSSDMIEMPVLFNDAGGGNGAVAYTNNVINCIVDGRTLIVPDVKGPTVFITPPAGVTFDPFDWYVEEAAKIIGFTTVQKVDDVWYHNRTGSIHCGTNVLRQIPYLNADKWWIDL